MYKQKLKHLMYEHQSNVAMVKADGELLLKAAGEEAAGREQELLKDKRGLQVELREQVMRSCVLLGALHGPCSIS